MNNTEFIKNKDRINELLEKLRKKLSSFEVINFQGQRIGKIKDFTLDKNRRLYMVLPQSDDQADSSVLLLSSKYIQKVDTKNRTLFVDISKAEIKTLPVYHSSKKKDTELSEYSPTAPVAQANIANSGKSLDFNETQSAATQSFKRENLEEVGDARFSEHEDTPEVVEEQIVRLLEERLLVKLSTRKVGDVVVRKQIETQFVEVPVQREKLVIDNVGSESKQPVEVEHLAVDQLSNDKETELSGHSPTRHTIQTNITSSGETQPLNNPFLRTEKPQEVDSQSFTESDNTAEVVEEEIIRLLEERLIVNRSKWKVGEVVVRKEIETEIVQVPIRREKLIIEQVGSETKQLAEIDLGKGDVTGVDLTEVPSSNTVDRSVPSADNSYNVRGEFLSPKAASHLLEAIALQKRHGCAKVRVELIVENPELQDTYQQMFDRCSRR